jgi:hypothetical protein
LPLLGPGSEDKIFILQENFLKFLGKCEFCPVVFKITCIDNDAGHHWQIVRSLNCKWKKLDVVEKLVKEISSLNVSNIPALLQV